MKRVLLVIAALLFSVIVADWWAANHAFLRVQRVIASDDLSLEVLDGVPIWQARYGRDRSNAQCVPAPGGARVVLMGDSIFHGVMLPVQDTLGPRIQATLPGPEGCVYNLAQPAFAMENELAIARRDFATWAPDVVVWEIWSNSPSHFTVVGESAWNFGRLALDRGGVPSVFGLEPVLNRRLFRLSGLYRWLTLGRARTVRRPAVVVWQEFVHTGLAQALSVTHETGASLILVMASSMERPFAETLSNERIGYALVKEWGAAHQVPVVDVAQEWIGHDPLDLRIDPCCHMNAQGHGLLAELLAPLVAAELAH
jgi:hypothetical protein